MQWLFLARLSSHKQGFFRDSEKKGKRVSGKNQSFEQHFLGKNSLLYDDLHSDHAKFKRNELGLIVHIMYNQPKLLEKFIDHNADWLVGIQNRLIDIAKGQVPITKDPRKDSGIEDDLSQLALKGAHAFLVSNAATARAS